MTNIIALVFFAALFIFNIQRANAIDLTGEPALVVVGEIAKDIVSSRDVLISEKIELVIFSPKGKTKSLAVPASGEEFKKLVTASLLEIMVYKEAVDIKATQTSDGEVDEAVLKVKAALSKDPQWQQLAVQPHELRSAANRKLVAKKFIKFKANSSVVKVSDQEALAYYEANRERFGQLPFANFKANIKAFLTRRQLDERLRDWFEVLQTKYGVKNLSNEI